MISILLSEASINDTSKFRPVDTQRPKTRGRPLKYYHPLLQQEKQINAVISKVYVLPKPIADSIHPKGSRLAHLYGLPKMHKEQLAMCPILSAMHTYNRPSDRVWKKMKNDAEIFGNTMRKWRLCGSKWWLCGKEARLCGNFYIKEVVPLAFSNE